MASALAPRPGILEISPYVGGRSRLEGRDKAIKLSSNESALGTSPRALEAYRGAEGQLYRYPDGGSSALTKAIGAAHGLDPARIVCGAGSDELLQLLARGYAGPGDEVLFTAHGFLVYPIAARAVGATPVVAPERELTADVDAILARVTARTRIVFLANPNNPTGTYLPKAELKRLRAGLPSGVLLVVDAAYAEFVTAADYSAGVELVDAGENVVMTRTFSKIYGLAGLRLGWAYCPPSIADVLHRIRGPFNVASPAQIAGIEAVRDQAHVARARDHNSRWLARLPDMLRQRGLKVTPSVANFVLVHFPENSTHNAKAAESFLNARGIIVRNVTNYGLPHCLRITIGLDHEMEAVADALEELMSAP
ncbi:MAG: histidinol-phosphate transaminase [Alphaproteobacteria bacterium]|nr:histidinol-phosphate transaminase [Alphaproteobacteria bacterium]